MHKDGLEAFAPGAAEEAEDAKAEDAEAEDAEAEDAKAEDAEAPAPAAENTKKFMESADLLVVERFEFTAGLEELSQNQYRVGQAVVRTAVSPDPRMAIAVASGTPLGIHGVLDISRPALTSMVRMAVAEANAHDIYKGTPYVVCVTLDYLPYILICLDRGSFAGKTDKYERDVAELVARKTESFIPVMLVNSKAPHCALTWVDI